MPSLPHLSLPPFSPQLRDGEIFDPLRRKFVALTPEEWVRQWFTDYLHNSLGYPRGLMANEVSLKLNNTLRRCDTIVYSARGMKPLMVVEYKAPHIAVTQRVFDQIARYNMVIGAPWLIVTNGLTHYCCRRTPTGYTFLPSIPPYTSLTLPPDPA